MYKRSNNNNNNQNSRFGRGSSLTVRKRRGRRRLNRRVNGRTGQPVNNREVRGETLNEIMVQCQPLRIPRNKFMTESVIVDLTYPDVVFNRNNSGAALLSWRYRMNSVFDPDPGVSSGAVPGHIEWAAFFSLYRVLEMSYTVDLANLEQSPVDVVIFPSQDDLGLNYSGLIEAFGNPYANQGMVSSKGGMDKVRLKGRIDIGKFYGLVTQYIGNDAYGASTAGNPSAFMYINLGGVSATNFTVSNGLDVRVTLKYTVFYHKRKFATG